MILPLSCVRDPCLEGLHVPLLTSIVLLIQLYNYCTSPINDRSTCVRNEMELMELIMSKNIIPIRFHRIIRIIL